MNKNGGSLTPQQQAQINRETAKLNKATHHDMRMNNPNTNMNPNFRPPYPQQNPGYNGQYTQAQQQQWLQNHPNGPPSTNNGQPNYNFPGRYHRWHPNNTQQ